MSRDLPATHAPGLGILLIFQVANRIYGDKRRKGMNEREYLHNTGDVFDRFRTVFLTKIYSRRVKYISCIVKIFFLTNTFPDCYKNSERPR